MIHKAAALILNFGGFAAVLILLIWRFTKHRSYGRTILEAWLGIFVWAVLNCIVFPLLFSALGYKDAFDYFPDTRGLLATALMGWVFGLELVAAIALVKGAWWLIIRSVHRFNKTAAVPSEPDATNFTKPRNK
jgi:hypothetical protein